MLFFLLNMIGWSDEENDKQLWEKALINDYMWKINVQADNKEWKICFLDDCASK